MGKINRLLYKLHRLLTIESLLEKQSKQFLYERRKEYLTYQAFKNNEPGVTSERYCDNEVIVSMATHGERFYEAYLAIESIMQQSIKPNRIILNVAKDEFEGKPIPPALRLQQKRGLEINYCEDYWSFKKIIPTLRRFPDAIIITVDDDCLYNMDMLENMIIAYKQDPTAIYGNVIHEITFDESKNIRSYMDWNMNINNTDTPSNLHFITSVGGVLYPPNSLYKDVLRDDIFMDICKTNDDIWCYAMMILAGTPIRKVRTHSHFGMDYIEVPEIQDSSLSKDNINYGEHHCQNDEIIKRVFDKYDIYAHIM